MFRQAQDRRFVMSDIAPEINENRVWLDGMKSKYTSALPSSGGLETVTVRLEMLFRSIVFFHFNKTTCCILHHWKA